MSHEIRTPINAIMSIAFLALQTDLSAQQQNYMTQINSSAKWLLGILDDILNFSKLEAGKVELEQHPFELAAVITFLNTVATPLLADKDVKLIFEVAPLVSSTFIGDSLRLGQVLLNLISNAIKFTHTGSVTLEVQLLSLVDNQASLNFSVTDTGIGLDMNHKNKLFEAFNQADNSTTRLYGGTGLGLSISKQLVSAMGGQINIESLEGSGSCFSFTISLETAPPLFVPSATPSLKHDVKYPKLINARILVVEDNLVIQEFIPDIMEHEGMQVDLANNGVEAIALLANNDYAAVLMDCQMPIMDGYEATKRIRTNPRFDTLPIIAMSGNVGNVDQQRCFDSGMNDFISKPVDWEQAFLTLNNWINKD
jgi:CheY-like chemotaxis protein